MFVWADGTVTGSVNIEELDAIQKALKPLSKAKQADLVWPIESVTQLADQLNVQAEADAKAAKAEAKKKEGT